MKIRNQILIYFTTTILALTAGSLTIIYILFSEYREEEFQQQQHEKIKYTIGLITEFKEMSEEVALLMDAQDINDFYDEKMLVFDGQKDLVFSSLDSLHIASTHKIINDLSPSNRWIETKEGDYDVIGVYLESKEKTYYAVSKAYDAFGYSKMYFLGKVIIAIFVAILIIVILVALYLSNKISKPITRLAENLNKYDLAGEEANLLQPDTSSYELQHLTQRFNELLERTKEAFSFQKNAIQHISHELKTPVAVLVSELEKTQTYTNIDELKKVLKNQIYKAKSLGEIINVFLEISKIQSGQHIHKSHLRIDELLFDIIEELRLIYPDFEFELNYYPQEIEEDKLLLPANKMLIKQAFLNLLLNCISYASDQKAQIKLDCSLENQLLIEISNFGKTVSSEEVKFLFQHSFRGRNSKGQIGFGLGLVLAQTIVQFHDGQIQYFNPSEELNIFQVLFQLTPQP